MNGYINNFSIVMRYGKRKDVLKIDVDSIVLLVIWFV